MSDHLLVGRRGVTLTANRLSSSRLMRLSIHPKHSASRTKSSYGIDLVPVWRLWNTSQTPGLDVWCVASHARHCRRLRTSSVKSSAVTPDLRSVCQRRIARGASVFIYLDTYILCGVYQKVDALDPRASIGQHQLEEDKEKTPMNV